MDSFTFGMKFIQILNNHTGIVWSNVRLDNQSFTSASEDEKNQMENEPREKQAFFRFRLKNI